MARFSISGYDNDSKCKICGSHASEMHHEGCELGAVYAEIKEARLVIEQFLKLLGVETITSAFAKIAAEQSVYLTALRRGLALSILFNVVLLAVVLATIGGR